MLLVIARKFNDIYYAMSLPEWDAADEKELIIISNRIPQKSFPHQDKFDEVRYFYYNGESIRNIIHILARLHESNFSKASTVILSNPVLVTNQYIINKVNPSVIIFIEDGSMNYTDFTPSKSIAKKILQFFLGISEKKIFNRINFTYLFYPDKATFFFGIRKKLSIRRSILPVNDKVSFIEGKKILVGQPLYSSGYLSLDRYNQLVNHIIKHLGINLYVPHAFASDKEEINCNKLNLNDYNITLEGLAVFHSFTLYSFGSTVLYSCRTINPNIHSVLITVEDESMKKLDTSFIRNFCDDICHIN